MTLDTASLFTFPVDFAGAGIDAVFDDVMDVAGLEEVTVAANYHAARDLFPHNPRFVAYTFPGGTAFLNEQLERYARLPLQPAIDPLVSEGYDVATLVARGTRRGLRTHAWLNYCHHDISPPTHDTAVANAFGEIDPGQLCPTNPAVQDYFTALTAHTAETGAQSIVAEGLHFAPAIHGYHHERWFNQLDDVTMFLLGLCFCSWCRNAGASTGIDAESLAHRVRQRIRSGLATPDANASATLGRPILAEQVGEDLCGYLDVRVATATGLTFRLADEARACGSRLVYMDPAGAIRGYSTGNVSDEIGPLPPWMLGTDLTAIAQELGEVAVMGYVRDTTVLDRVIRSYQQALPPGADLRVVLRPAPPDCSGARTLADKIAVCADAGAARVDFYNYAFTPRANLRWIRSAIAALVKQ